MREFMSICEYNGTYYDCKLDEIFNVEKFCVFYFVFVTCLFRKYAFPM